MDGFFGMTPDAVSERIAREQHALTVTWHGTEENAAGVSFFEAVARQHGRNFRLWHEEDDARSPSADDVVIAGVKRRIDKLNQQRNDLIETLDDMILSELTRSEVATPESARWNSETPGSMIDRMSILSLKVFHMKEQEDRADASDAHRQACREKRERLETQRRDLGQALAWTLADLCAGKLRMKLYRQFKMYNDPSLNPAIYGAAVGNQRCGGSGGGAKTE